MHTCPHTNPKKHFLWLTFGRANRPFSIATQNTSDVKTKGGKIQLCFAMKKKDGMHKTKC